MGLELKINEVLPRCFPGFGLGKRLRTKLLILFGTIWECGVSRSQNDSFQTFSNLLKTKNVAQAQLRIHAIRSQPAARSPVGEMEKVNTGRTNEANKPKTVFHRG